MKKMGYGGRSSAEENPSFDKKFGVPPSGGSGYASTRKKGRTA
jgi:hypothetical protein